MRTLVTVLFYVGILQFTWLAGTIVQAIRANWTDAPFWVLFFILVCCAVAPNIPWFMWFTRKLDKNPAVGDDDLLPILTGFYGDV